MTFWNKSKKDKEKNCRIMEITYKDGSVETYKAIDNWSSDTGFSRIIMILQDESRLSIRTDNIERIKSTK